MGMADAMGVWRERTRWVFGGSMLQLMGAGWRGVGPSSMGGVMERIARVVGAWTTGRRNGGHGPRQII